MAHAALHEHLQDALGHVEGKVEVPHDLAGLAVDPGDLSLLGGDDDHLADAELVAHTAVVARHGGDQSLDVPYLEVVLDRRVELDCCVF